MHSIMIIHPEGNFNNNPNLYGIIEILCENGYKVHVFSPRLGRFDQSAPCAGSKIVLNDPTTLLPFTTAVFPSDVLKAQDSIRNHIHSHIPRFDLVIGVDRGIIEAAAIAKYYKIPYGLISYEILFAEEAGGEYLRADIEASRDVSFAVCQDRLRAFHLARENGIPLNKIIDIPVAGRSAKPSRRTFFLHDQLGIPRMTKIALYIGSVMSPFAGISELIAESDRWPDDWVLVLHERFSQYSPEIARRIELKGKKNIFYSQLGHLPFNRIYELLHSADIGLSLYVPQFGSNNIYVGNNIKYLGMASGKTAVYLQHSVPILINEVGEMSQHTRRKGLGRVVEDLREIPSVLSSLSREELYLCREKCISFFQKVLDLDVRSQPLLARVHSLLRDRRIANFAKNGLEVIASGVSLQAGRSSGCQEHCVRENGDRKNENGITGQKHGALNGDMGSGVGNKVRENGHLEVDIRNRKSEGGWESAQDDLIDRMADMKRQKSTGMTRENEIGSEELRGCDILNMPKRIAKEGFRLDVRAEESDSVKLLEDVTACYADDACIHSEIGKSDICLGDKGKTLQYYQKSVALEPENAIFQKCLADFYYVILGQVEEALEHYARALSSDAENIDTLLMLGHISISKMKFDEARVFYNRILEIEPSNRDARDKLAAIERGLRSDVRAQM
jgi:tetratricopeptide (TPR) repeat protein